MSEVSYIACARWRALWRPVVAYFPSYLRAFLWSVAFQIGFCLWVYRPTCRYGIYVPFEVAAVAGGVFIATFRRFSFGRCAASLTVACISGLFLRVAWLWYEWDHWMSVHWAYEAGLLLQHVVVPLLLAFSGLLPRNRFSIHPSGCRQRRDATVADNSPRLPRRA